MANHASSAALVLLLLAIGLRLLRTPLRVILVFGKTSQDRPAVAVWRAVLIDLPFLITAAAYLIISATAKQTIGVFGVLVAACAILTTLADVTIAWGRFRRQTRIQENATDTNKADSQE